MGQENAKAKAWIVSEQCEDEDVIVRSPSNASDVETEIMREVPPDFDDNYVKTPLRLRI